MKEKQPKSKKKKIIILAIEIIVLAIVLIMLFFYRKVDQIQIVEVQPEKIEVNELPEETVEILEENITIALFGLDNRSTGDYSAGNSDVIMILNIDKNTDQASLVSVYRDTYLNVAAVNEDNKFRKANSAFAYGGVEQAITMLNRNLDIEVDSYVCVDFRAVSDAINVLGGIELEVTGAEVTHLNDYIDDLNEHLGTNASHIGSGYQTLNGVQAVAYARIRYTAGDDYKRAQRQRKVISLMMDKVKAAVKSGDISTISKLIDAVLPKIQTDLTKLEMVSLVQTIISCDMTNSSGFPYSKSTTDIAVAGDIVVPCSLETNVIELHKNLFGEENYVPSENVKIYSSIIIQSTGKTAESGYRDEYSGNDGFFSDGVEGDSE